MGVKPAPPSQLLEEEASILAVWMQCASHSPEFCVIQQRLFKVAIWQGSPEDPSPEDGAVAVCAISAIGKNIKQKYLLMLEYTLYSTNKKPRSVHYQLLTVPTTCNLPDFFIFGKPSACISLYIRSYGSVKCRPFSCQAGGRGFESLRSRSLKPRFLVEISGFFVALLYFPDMTVNDTNRPFLK